MTNPSQLQIDQFERDGYVLAPAVFSPAEVAAYIDHYMTMRAAGSYPGDSGGVDIGSNDPLKKFPRMIHMHRWDEVSLRWMTDARLNAWITALTGSEPYATQTMLYFKPPGARGQALHQDQFYLRTQPGTCVAAWMALDTCDTQNGCLLVVPGSAKLPVLCTQTADTTVSFTDVTVPLPDHLAPVPVEMEPGDVLFFNGSVIHGSLPNLTTDRFRRALIGHYVTGNAEQVAAYYHPVLRMDGTEVALGISEHGGPCGVWTDVDGVRDLEMVDPREAEGALALHE